MSKPRIGIVIGSTRENRLGEKIARWVHGIATRRADLAVELVDLRDYPLPFFEGASPSRVPVANEVAKHWGKKMAELDAYLFVTGEYNYSIPGVLKNALDWAYYEYNRKPAAYVGYGSVGGARAIQQLRLINVELQMAPTRTSVHIGGTDFYGILLHGKVLEEMPHLAQAAGAMLDDFAWWTKALKTAREATAERTTA